ncbi:hypothetical protein CLCR_05991 [Cladophialophora carrionii]|uniref:LPXTG-domain-containing protein n=1 Tax=Cladophialophora carrionii TaxID=86049 RepID=A0A1C1C708_9EURO|nr:hypothetical protein CLCR_05991 [Cladophialophora carrionii]
MLTFLLFFATWVSRSHCLEVTNTSLCADACNGPSLTYSSDLSCSDDEYWNTADGVLFRSCLDCESTSSAESGDTSTPQNNDLYWFLCEGGAPRYLARADRTVNMKYTLQFCMFQGNGSTPNLPQCEADCAGLYPVLQTSWFSPEPAEQYAYCSINDTAFPTYASTCASCLLSDEGSVVLGNFLNTLQSACDNQPDASLGETIPLQRALFDTATVGTATATSTADSSTISATTSSASSDRATTGTVSTASGSAKTPPPAADPINTGASAQETSQSSSPGISPGAAAGIGIGCGLGAIALAAGLGWFFLNRRRRLRRGLSPANTFQYQESKSALLSVSPPQPVPLYAQQLASRELHEMDGKQSKTWTSELDGRPVH